MIMPQRWLIKVVKAVFILSFACFVLIQIHTRRPRLNLSPPAPFVDDWSKNLIDLSTDQSLTADVGADQSLFEQQRRLPTVRPNLSILFTLERLESSPVAIGGNEPEVGLPSADEIRRSVEDNNANAPIWNDAMFSATSQIDHVIVVQVHNRSNYLEKLIQSLGQSKFIARTLLIFSHDFISQKINKQVQSIDFCRVMQIIFPSNLQIFTKTFPAQEPDDCGPELTQENAKKNNCKNWNSTDHYGHYRTAANSQIKHHWWWKVNYVFDGIPRLLNYTGWVLLLEEDHYVSPDFLHVFEQIIRRKRELCNECSIISLGNYLKKYDSESYSRMLHQAFCNYDDYNWDWSLMHINMKCMAKPQMRVIFSKAPRVFHIGDCGIHHKGDQCTADASANKVAAILKFAQPRLFPENLEVVERNNKSTPKFKEFGGWADARDRKLCLKSLVAPSFEPSKSS